MLPSKYSAQAIFQHHIQWKKCTLYSIKYSNQFWHLRVSNPSLLNAVKANRQPRHVRALHLSKLSVVRLGCKYLKKTNTLAYYFTTKIKVWTPQLKLLWKCHDIQPTGTRQNESKHYDPHEKDNQHKTLSKMTFSKTALRKMTFQSNDLEQMTFKKFHSAKWHLEKLQSAQWHSE